MSSFNDAIFRNFFRIIFGNYYIIYSNITLKTFNTWFDFFFETPKALTESNLKKKVGKINTAMFGIRLKNFLLLFLTILIDSINQK